MANETLADGRGVDALISEATGLIIDPYFSSTKLAWLLDNVEGARQAATDAKLCFGTVDSYLIWRLSKGRSTLLTPRTPVEPSYSTSIRKLGVPNYWPTLKSRTRCCLRYWTVPLLLQQPTPNGLARLFP